VRHRLMVVFATAVAIGVVGCGGDDSDDIPTLRIDLIDDAVAAVEDELGGDIAFYEVNATPNLVNVFVATSDDDGGTTATAYVYEPGGGLGDAAAPETATGPTFTADQIAFDPDVVLDQAIEKLPTSIVRVFAVNGAAGPDGPADSVNYRIVFESVEGGSLAVLVSPDGGILGADAE
jgi:hypothetical protein